MILNLIYILYRRVVILFESDFLSDIYHNINNINFDQCNQTALEGLTNQVHTRKRRAQGNGHKATDRMDKKSTKA